MCVFVCVRAYTHTQCSNEPTANATLHSQCCICAYAATVYYRQGITIVCLQTEKCSFT